MTATGFQYQPADRIRFSSLRPPDCHSLPDFVRAVSSVAELGGSCDHGGVVVNGCNIVGPLCDCGRASLCPNEGRPFAFDTREECDLNLGVMLEGERQSYEGERATSVTV